MPTTLDHPDPSATHTVSEARRLCRSCLSERDASQFRRVNRKTGARAAYCNVCHVRRETKRKANDKREADRRFVVTQWGKMARSKEQRLCMTRLVMELMDRFGGASAVAEKWHRCFVEATTVDKRTKSLHAILALTKWLNDAAEDSPQFDAMSVQQLNDNERAVRNAVVAEALRDDPVMVAAIAQRHGFTLTKSDGQDRR